MDVKKLIQALIEILSKFDQSFRQGQEPTLEVLALLTNTRIG
jgi:hypothetical protein